MSFREGESFGEESALNKSASSLSYVTSKPTVVYKISTQDFYKYCGGN